MIFGSRCQRIKNGPSKICKRQPWKIFWRLSQIFLGPFVDTLTHSSLFFSVPWVFLGLCPWNLKDEHLNQHISKSKTRRYLKFMDEKSLNIRSNNWILLQMIWCRKILSLFWNSGKNSLISFLYFLFFLL